MSSAVETEIKFSVGNLRSLAARLRASGFRLITPRTHEMNTLYDLPSHPLRSRGALLRVRKYGERWIITFKGKAKFGRYKSRPEIETTVEDGKSLLAILECAGFISIFRYEKFRSEWTDGRGHLLIDETPIGNFCELEGPGNWIDSIAARLQIIPAEYITDSYATLFLKWKRRTHSKAKYMCFAEVREA